MQQLAQNNLFTAFNNIEKIKQERKLKPVIRVEEMIKTIKEHYNLNAPMLANNLGVDVQAIYRWEKGGRPNIKWYNKIKELYEGIAKESKEEALEQPKITTKVIEKDVTVGTPFIELTSITYEEKVYININKIQEIYYLKEGTSIVFKDKDYSHVKESPTEVLELIRKNSKENEKN